MSEQQQITVDDCWNRIGVWAGREQRSCEELEAHSHCRNCPSYKAAGRMLLQRPVELMDPDELAIVVEKTTTDVSYVCFRVGQEWFSLITNKILSTINPLPVRKIPHVTASSVEGICYNDGDSLLVIDMASLIPGINVAEGEEEGKKSFERFLLMSSPMGKLALRVNEVWGTQCCALSEFKAVSVADSDKSPVLIRYRLPWQGGEISDIETEVLYQMLKQQL